jgi:hypothetical protein
MTKTAEGVVKAYVDMHLRRHKAYSHKPVQNGYGCPALDYHVCHRGLYAGIETKRLGETFTRRQARIARQILNGGGSVFLVDDEEGPGIDDLVNWLADPRPGYCGLYTAQHLAKLLLETTHDTNDA